MSDGWDLWREFDNDRRVLRKVGKHIVMAIFHNSENNSMELELTGSKEEKNQDPYFFFTGDIQCTTEESAKIIADRFEQLINKGIEENLIKLD